MADWKAPLNLRGPAGPQGPRGPKGDKGDKGEAGETGDISGLQNRLDAIEKELDVAKALITFLINAMPGPDGGDNNLIIDSNPNASGGNNLALGGNHNDWSGGYSHFYFPPNNRLAIGDINIYSQSEPDVGKAGRIMTRTSGGANDVWVK